MPGLVLIIPTEGADGGVAGSYSRAGLRPRASRGQRRGPGSDEKPGKRRPELGAGAGEGASGGLGAMAVLGDGGPRG